MVQIESVSPIVTAGDVFSVPWRRQKLYAAMKIACIAAWCFFDFENALVNRVWRRFDIRNCRFQFSMKDVLTIDKSGFPNRGTFSIDFIFGGE
jgi:hypothetical protein